MMSPNTTLDEISDYVPENSLRSVEEAHLDDLLKEACERGSSDLHLTVGLPPVVRIDGLLTQLDYKPLSPADTQRLIYDVLTNEQVQHFEAVKELDYSYSVRGTGRFRANIYKQRGSVGGAFRAIPDHIPTFEQLSLPLILRELSRKHSGLILVTGPTGSGKSTTIACMIDTINSEKPVHILTMEDPIEYLHRHKKGMINQRELKTDTDSFGNALRSALREDPDVILIGEMRDLETIQAALTLAETGHMVFGTLHTRNAPQTIDRVIDVFPPHQQEQIKVQLSNTLEAVIAQQLIPRIGSGRVVAVEIMVATAAIRNLIREGKTHQIYSVVETGAQFGMQTMDKVLADLVRTGRVTMEEAMMRSIDIENFKRFQQGG